MSRWRWAIFASTALPFACSSFDPVDAPNVPDATTPDAVTPAPGVDGATDSEAPDTGPARGCAGRVQDPAHFCDDFDTTADIGFLWQHLVTEAGALEGTDASYSGSRALKAGFPDGAPTGSTAWLRRTRDIQLSLANKTRLALAFSLRVLDAPFPANGNGYMHAAIITFDPTSCTGDKNRAVEFNFAANGEQLLNLKGLARAACPDGGGSDFVSFKGPFGMTSYVNDFRRVTIAFSKGACIGGTGTASLLLTVDGVPSPCQTLEVDPFEAAGRLDLNVGAFAGREAVGKASFIIDDITLDAD